MASTKNTATATTAAVPAASGNLPQQIGIIPEFDGDTDDWTVYREILEEFFKANGVLEASKVSVLISVIGADTYRMLRDLCHPDAPKDKTYEQLCGLLAKQFIPEIAIFRERAKFYRAEQRRGEDVKAWYARLKKLSVDCNFGEHLERLLLDKFVVGLTPGPVLDRLCEEKETITLKDAVDLAANRESAVQDEVMAEDLGDLSLDERRGRGRRRHGRHHRGHHHFGPHGGPHWGGGPHGFGHMMGMAFGHGPPRHPHPQHPHHGPMGRRGPPGPPEFFGGFRGFEGGRCPFRQRGRDMERCAKKWRKHHGRRSSSSSSSSSSESTSSSSSSDEDENKRRKCRKGHKKGHHGGRHGRHFGHGGPHGKHGGRRGRCGGRKQAENTEPVATENTEPELIE